MQLTPKERWSPLYVDGNVNGGFTVKTTPDGNPNQKFYWTTIYPTLKLLYALGASAGSEALSPPLVAVA